MKLTDCLTALSIAVVFGVLAAGCSCSDDEPAPKPGATGAPAATPDTQAAGTEVNLPPRPTNLPPPPVVTVTEGATSDGTVTVLGTARVSGRIPLTKEIAMDHVPGCKAHATAVNENVIADDQGRLKNVICFVARGLDEKHFQSPPEAPAVLDQVGCTYVPHVMTMRTGQQLLIKNTDKVRHNVNASPWRSANEKFNTLVVRSSPDLDVTFQEQEVAIPFACDIHAWMKGYVAVLDHDFSSISAADGSYSIAGLPPGKLVFEAWHEEYGRQTLELELEAGQSVQVDWMFLSKKRKGGRVVPVLQDQ